MEEVLSRLRAIELDILAQGTQAEHVGSLKLVSSGTKALSVTRPSMNKRIPSFGQGIGKDIRHSSHVVKHPGEESSTEDEDMDEDDLKEILKDLGSVRLGKLSALSAGEGTWRTARWGDDPDALQVIRKAGKSVRTSVYQDASEMRGLSFSSSSLFSW